MPYLQECVESVLSQPFQNWEMLISDDGSTDSSREYLAKLDDPRIKVIIQEENLGIFGNLNYLAKLANAPLSYILCQDDYFFEGGLDKVMQCWAKQPAEIGAIRFNHGEIDLAKNRFVRKQRQMLPAVITPSNSALHFYVFGNLLSNLSNNSLRTHLIEDVGGFDQEFPYAGDFEFWTRLGSEASIRFEDQFVTYIRRHPNTASNLLNKRGELVPQLHRIVQRLGPKITGAPTLLMRWHATSFYDSPHRYLGVRIAALGRKMGYLGVVTSNAAKNPWFMGRLGCWLVFFVTSGGRFHQATSAGMVLRKYRGTAVAATESLQHSFQKHVPDPAETNAS